MLLLSPLVETVCGFVRFLITAMVAVGVMGSAVAADSVVGYWPLDDTDGDTLRNRSKAGTQLDATIEGPVALNQPGPSRDWFPFFANVPRAIALAGGTERAIVAVADPGQASDLDFGPGETISLEAWINVDAVDEDYAMILGKGTDRGDAAQLNYSLGVRYHLTHLWPSFAFTPAGSADGNPGVVCRWESLNGFPRDSGWHHLAVTFEFGRPESLRLYFDGVPQPGTWTEGTAKFADQSPRVNDLPLQIVGTSKALKLKGAVAEARVHRGELTEADLRRRMSVTLPAVSPNEVSPQKVKVELREGGPFSHGWIFDSSVGALLATHEETALGLYRLPQRYVATGVRGDWPSPLLVRATTRVNLPAGRHRFLLRAHSMARLLMDGEVVAEVNYRQLDQSGNTHVEFIPAPPTPETRPLALACREVLVEFDCAGGEKVFVLETRTGGRSTVKGELRHELGETLAAVQVEGEGQFTLLGPGKRVPLTDSGWLAFVQERERYYTALDDTRRRELQQVDRDYWAKRHETARQHVAALPPLDLPVPSRTLPEANLVDRFINAKIERSLAAADLAPTAAVQFHRDVLPILEDNCMSCHSTKPKGKFKLDERVTAFTGGDSGAPGIVPGHPEESEIVARILTDDPDDIMPAKGDPLKPDQIRVIEEWIRNGAVWPDEAPARPVVMQETSDYEFVRRIFLDVVGQIPSVDEMNAFLEDKRADKRTRLIDRLLADKRWADNWVGYWQDLLAENPVLANLSSNATGPFRWWIHESFLDNKPMDLMATELIAMEGSRSSGGPAGFAIAAGNDAPLAEKALIISGAFLGTRMECARCHDAPFHESTQQDLFSLAAMLNNGPLKVPLTSSVPAEVLDRPGALIKVTLAPGSTVEPEWSLTHLISPDQVPAPPRAQSTPRNRLAAAVTAPGNQRFAEVMVNRVWQRYFGRGLMPSLDDWETGKVSHPELLDYLARYFMSHNYDLKELARHLLTSRAYQRKAFTHEDSNRLFAAQPRRQMTAEQIVDSLPVAFGVPILTEPLNLDLYNTREFTMCQNLDTPLGPQTTRPAWQFATAPLDRDRTSLSLPRVQAVTEVLSAFGWRGSRFESVSLRETPMNPLQPAILANGTLSLWLIRLSDESGMTRLALRDQPVGNLVESVFLRVLNREPNGEESRKYTKILEPGYTRRIVSTELSSSLLPDSPRPVLSWTNNMMPEATTLRVAEAQRARAGPPPTARLAADWRERMEDVLWSVLNSPETLFLP